MYKFDFNELFLPVFTGSPRIIDIWGGRGRGGSHFITDFALFKITQTGYFRAYFMREVKGQVRESLFRDFKDRIEENSTVSIDEFKINESTMEIIHLATGNTINCRGFKKSSLKHTAKQKSLAGATHIFIDEADEINEDDFDQLDMSLRTKKANCQIFRCYNSTHKGHWIVKNYYDITPVPNLDGFYTAQPKPIPDFLSVFGTYYDNIKNINEKSIQKWESYFEEKPDYYWSNVHGYITGGIKGLIYRNTKRYTKLPNDIEFYEILGLDFGGNDPYALVKLYIHGASRRVWIKQLLYESNTTNDELINVCKEHGGKDEIICDSARKDKIMELMNAGINAVKCRKGADSIISGIDIVKSYELFFHVEDAKVLHEIESYKWAVNFETKEPLDKPEDKNNHALDAIRYALTHYHFYYKTI